MFTTAIGFLAQGLFSARILVQWLMSERARRVLSPTIFWVLSLIGSCLLCTYGWLRTDFAIILGQFLSYYVYLWNLKSKGVWRAARLRRSVPLRIAAIILRTVLTLLPAVAVGAVLSRRPDALHTLFAAPGIPLWLLIYGSAGQILFTLRFIYQWYYSSRRGLSTLPAGFWIISLVGSLTIVSYAIMRLDLVLIVGQSFGIVAYTRNLIILRRQTPAG